MIQQGKFYGIGVGPGAPDLLTVRAANILKTVDIVCVPRSSKENDSVALKVAGSYISDKTEILEISTPMTRDTAVLNAEWESGAAVIAKKLYEGKSVAFITIGDAMLFSTYTYILKKLKSLLPGVYTESIPGITSFSATAAFINTALAEGSEKLAIIPAIEDPNELRSILAKFPNAVLMKVAGKFNEIVEVLDELQLKNKAVYVSKLGYPDQFITYDLDSLKNTKRDYLSLILVKREGF
ncbi:MAG: precorrin-2 C(20)-methyltransferase [Veillonellaceae bacterium]|jgi:precorrin-2/cobalt-factor-2 C20-methyltransferase|nr:precorrin-2 C(20)-methyltransferase [Veillonellaceae bacterium]